MFGLDALPALFARHHRPTTLWLVRRAGSVGVRGGGSYLAESAEDAVQEAWAQLIARGLDARDVMPGLLMRVASRAFMRAHWRRSVALDAHAFAAVWAPGPLVTATSSAASAADQLDLDALAEWVLGRYEPVAPASRRTRRAHRACAYCGTSLAGMKLTARFCRPSHRVAFHAREALRVQVLCDRCGGPLGEKPARHRCPSRCACGCGRRIYAANSTGFARSCANYPRSEVRP